MNKNNLKKTKIVSTFGPSITQKIWDFEIMKANPEMVKKAEYMIEGVINAGINTIRLNFSHGTHEEQQIRVELTRGVSRRLNKPISVLYDTKGPEIRCHDFGGEGKDTVNKGATVTIECLKKVEGNAKKFSVTDSSGKYNMAKDCKIGNLVCIDDGKLRLKITDVKVAAGQVICEALNTHVIGTKKRINLPGAEYSMPFLSEKDINDTKFACENNYDYLAASFTNSASDINAIKTICRKSGGSGKTIKIIAKIETMAGCRNLESIINACDGIMVARGDLGIEIPYFEVPYWEAKMIELCRKAGKIVIVATQMLDSMETRIAPSRAEVTDVFYAGHLGTDATMLSGETAQGAFPVEAVETMATINRESEFLFNYDKAITKFKNNKAFGEEARKIAIQIAKKTAPSKQKTLAASFPYELVVLFTNKDEVVRAVSSIRPGAAVVVVCDSESMWTRYGVNYGIYTYHVDSLKNAITNKNETIKAVVKHYATGSKKVIGYAINSFIKYN